MSTNVATPPVTTPQAEQFDQWMKNATALMEKHSASLNELPDKIKTQLIAELKEDIAKLRDDVADSKEAREARFRAIADHHGRSGGAYRGPCGTAEKAKQIGNLVRAMYERDFAKLGEMEKAAITPGKGVDGGYLLGEGFIPELIYNVEQYGVFERNCPAMDISGVTSSQPKFTSGATVYYPDYGATFSDSTPKFAQVKWQPTRYASAMLVENWMLGANLAVALGDFVVTELTRALAQAADTNGFMGDGSDTYARVIGAFKRNGTNQLIVSGNDSGRDDDAFDEVIAEHVRYLPKVCGTAPDWIEAFDPKWFMHRQIFFRYMGVTDANKNPVANVMLGENGKPAKTLIGYPVEFTQVAPKLADSAVSTVMAIWGALSRGFGLGRRNNSFQLRTSDQVKFFEGQTALLLEVTQDIAERDNQAYVQLKTNS